MRSEASTVFFQDAARHSRAPETQTITYFTHPCWNPPLPERIWFYPVDAVRNVAKFEAMDSKFSLDITSSSVPRLYRGAPAGGEARSSIVPAENGGNMDAPEASAGTPSICP